MDKPNDRAEMNSNLNFFLCAKFSPRTPMARACMQRWIWRVAAYAFTLIGGLRLRAHNLWIDEVHRHRQRFLLFFLRCIKWKFEHYLCERMFFSASASPRQRIFWGTHRGLLAACAFVHPNNKQNLMEKRQTVHHPHSTRVCTVRLCANCRQCGSVRECGTHWIFYVRSRSHTHDTRFHSFVRSTVMSTVFTAPFTSRLPFTHTHIVISSELNSAFLFILSLMENGPSVDSDDASAERQQESKCQTLSFLPAHETLIFFSLFAAKNEDGSDGPHRPRLQAIVRYLWISWHEREEKFAFLLAAMGT